jgi:signal transduction histidine kinase
MTFEVVKVLLVDDLEENLTALEALLRSAEIAILKARSGADALELLLKHEVALALIDVQMPGMDGFELAELMHGNLRTKGVPIIFLTAATTDKQRRYKGYEAGAVDFLQKPIEPDVLKSKASVFFELHRRRQEIARQRDELELATQEARQYATALKEADKRKDEFLATLAHELRTPLAPLRNGLEILRREPDSGVAMAVRDMMERQLSNMVQLVDDLLDMSRVSEGKIVLRKKTTDLQSIISSAIESAQPHIEKASHDLRVELADVPIWVEADFTRIDQIISNLLNNAAKYTASGGTITLSAKEENGMAIVAVKDTGVGIPSSMLSKIFDLFTQVNTSIDQSQGGLGIGLALVKHLVSLHGGLIKVESDGPGEGSTFTVSLPATVAPSSEQVDSQQTSTSSAAPLQILIVDDNVDSATTTGWLLEMMGHKYSLAHTGPYALELAQTLQPDVVLLDIGLPGMSGYEVCRQMRSNPLFENTLIVAQTGWGQERDREMARQAGFDHHLVKPLKLDDIMALFATVVA